MRKTYLIALLFCALAVGCHKEYDEANNQIKGATIHAVSDVTRASFDGERSTWSDGDRLQVAIAEAGAGFTLHEFELKSSADNSFVNEEIVLNPQLTYNVYGLYSMSNIEPDVEDMTAIVAVGATEQTQNSTSASHIASYDPLYGGAMGVYYNDISMAMNHTAVALKIDIENTTDATIQGVKSLKITAPNGVNLSGNREIDFNDFSISAVEDGSGSNTVVVNIASSGVIAKNEKFTVWVATTPFTMENGDKLHFTITTTDDKVLAFTKTFSTKTLFMAGQIRHTTIQPVAQAEEIAFGWGYLDGYVRPIGMPTCEKDTNDDVNKLEVQSGSYSTEYGDITITGNVNYAYVSTGGYIRFKDITSSKSTSVTLPVIAGYSLSQVKVYINREKQSDLRISIHPSSLSAKNTSNDPAKFTLDDSTADTQYSLKITSIGASKESYDLRGIELIYVLE